jgi:hypothetical protein
MEDQAHASCNRHAGCCVRATAPPLAPLPRLLDYGTSTVTRGNPAYDPAVPAWRDGQYGQKWAGSNGGGRRAGAAVTSSAKLMSHPKAVREPSLSRREDGAPVFRSSNGSRTRNGRPVNRSPRRISSAAGQAAPLAGKQATLRLRHNDRVKKGTPRHSISYPFPFPLSLSYNRDRERGIPRKGSFSVKETGPEPPY